MFSRTSIVSKTAPSKQGLGTLWEMQVCLRLAEAAPRQVMQVARA